MRFRELAVHRVYLVEIQPIFDERGYFTPLFDAREFKAATCFDATFDYCAMSYNTKPYTLRGMHYQIAPDEEIKLVTCIKGSIYDVVLDLRPESTSYKRWTAVNMYSHRHQLLLIPKGCAHGFMTLDYNTEVLYYIAGQYNKESERGVRWDDPVFEISWPHTPKVLSERDRSHPLWRNAF